MNWDAIGAVGEVAGAAGVIFTLFYLALQIRTSNLATRQAAMQELMDASLAVTSQISSDREIADLWIRGCANADDLTASEIVQYRSLLQQLLFVWERSFFLREQDRVSGWITQELDLTRRNIMKSPGFRAFFEDRKQVMSGPWMQYLEQELASLTGTYAPLGLGAAAAKVASEPGSAQ